MLWDPDQFFVTGLLQLVSIPLELVDPTLDIIFQVQPWQCQLKRKTNFTSSATLTLTIVSPKFVQFVMRAHAPLAYSMVSTLFSKVS